MKTIYCYILLFATLGVGACSEDFLEPEISTSKDVATSINTLDDLRGIVLGAYDRMNASDYYGKDYIIFAEVRSDNAFSNGASGRYVTMGQFFLNPTDGYPTNTWEQIYQVIANANIVINAEVENNESADVQYTKGQAYALRALGHMDLLRLYGQQNTGGNLGIPIVTTFSDGNPYPERATVDAVWEQIGQDLQTAADIMDPALNKDKPAAEITTWAVPALQSRYYLYTEEYDQAAAAAKKVIDGGAYRLTDATNHVEAWGTTGAPASIFELAFTETDNLTFNSLYFMYQATTYGDIEVTNDLYDLYDDADVRKELYTKDSTVIRMTGKYPTPLYTDNIKVIRYAEVILNYAEALARTGSPEALTVLNQIPANRGAALYTEATLDNVLLERRKELAMEGHRFFDLMRTGQGIPYVDPRQTFSKEGIPYGDPALAFPIPQSEIAANPNVAQNESY